MSRCHRRIDRREQRRDEETDLSIYSPVIPVRLTYRYKVSLQSILGLMHQNMNREKESERVVSRERHIVAIIY